MLLEVEVATYPRFEYNPYDYPHSLWQTVLAKAGEPQPVPEERRLFFSNQFEDLEGD